MSTLRVCPFALRRGQRPSRPHPPPGSSCTVCPFCVPARTHICLLLGRWVHGTVTCMLLQERESEGAPARTKKKLRVTRETQWPPACAGDAETHRTSAFRSVICRRHKRRCRLERPLSGGRAEAPAVHRGGVFTGGAGGQTARRARKTGRAARERRARWPPCGAHAALPPRQAHRPPAPPLAGRLAAPSRRQRACQ